MLFEWDVLKEKANIKKHSISFEEASYVFLDEDRIEKYDNVHSIYYEDRYKTIGRIGSSLIITVSCVFKDENLIRMISARKATKKRNGCIMKKTISVEEIKKLSELSEERIKEIKDFKEDFSDPEIPPFTDEELKQFERAKDLHPEWYKPRKITITIRLDIDVVEKYKSLGKGYQTRMNSDLRKAIGLK